MQVANIHIATLEGRHRIGENPCRAEKLEMREKFKMRGSWVFIFLELQCFSSKNKINGEHYHLQVEPNPKKIVQ